MADCFQVDALKWRAAAGRAGSSIPQWVINPEDCEAACAISRLTPLFRLLQPQPGADQLYLLPIPQGFFAS
jgi:hypothetical protein